jgi:hypothetical protein
MIYRLFLAASLVSITAGALPAHAQAPAPAPAPTPAATAAMPAVPKQTCVKPELPRAGGSAEALRMSAFNRDYKTYADCVKKYVEDTNALATASNALATASIAAGKAAIDEFNSLNAELNARREASPN